MSNKTMSYNACYACTRVSVPLSFNSARHFLGYESTAQSDVTTVKYAFYEHKGLYWFSISLPDGYVANSLFFVDFVNLVHDFRDLCRFMGWVLSDSRGLSSWAAQVRRS